MPTNKKKSKSQKLANNNNDGTKPIKASKSDPWGSSAASKPGLSPMQTLTWAQFIILLLLSMGISRLLQIKSAYLTTEEGADGVGVDGVGEPSKFCVDHMGDAACREPSVLRLLQLKYQTGIQTAVLILMAALQCWKREDVLQRLHGLLMFTPLTTAIAVLWASKAWISPTHVTRQLPVAFVLMVLAKPPPHNVVFKCPSEYRTWASAKNLSTMTLQCMLLLTLAGWYFLECLYYGVLLPVSSNVPNVVEQWVLTDPMTTTPTATTPIMYLILVDQLTRACVFLFAWYYFHDSEQRNFLLFHSLLKLWEYLVQLPGLHEVMLNAAQHETIALTMAIVSGIAWIAPSLAWKPSSSSSPPITETTSSVTVEDSKVE